MKGVSGVPWFGHHPTLVTYNLCHNPNVTINRHHIRGLLMLSNNQYYLAGVTRLIPPMVASIGQKPQDSQDLEAWRIIC